MKFLPSVCFYLLSFLPLVSMASILTDECIALIQESRGEICRLSSGEDYKKDKVFSTFQPHWSTDQITLQRYNTITRASLEHLSYQQTHRFSKELCDVESLGCVLAFYRNKPARSGRSQRVNSTETTSDSRFNGTFADNYAHRMCLNVDCTDVKVPEVGFAEALKSQTAMPESVTICCLCHDPLQKTEAPQKSNPLLNEGFEYIDMEMMLPVKNSQ